MPRAAITGMLVTCLTAMTAAAEWRPAQAPLMTRFAADVKPDAPLPDYPRPQLTRPRWQNLNGLWDFAITGHDAPKPEAFDKQILVPFCVESALSGVMGRVTENDAVWYSRQFQSPKLTDGERLLLHFGAVDWHAQVLVNGKPVGEHLGGYNPFSFDITDALSAGGSQTLTVRVWDPTDTAAQPRGKQVLDPKGIWYTAVTGIWQTVWLEPVPAASIERLTIAPDVDRGVARVSANVRGAAGDAKLKIVVRDEGNVVVEGTGDVLGFDLAIPDAKLWSPDSPHLYDVSAALVNGERELDTVGSYFGMRKIEMAKAADGRMRLLLNGQPLFQYGTLDQGWWPDGLYTAPTDAALVYDVEMLKAAGFNMLRKHVKTEPARFYHHCDRLGMLVWQDMPSGMIQVGGTQRIQRGGKDDVVLPKADAEQFRVELAEMIDSLRHFPSIVAWVPFNEGWGQHDTNAVLKWTAEYDPTRPIDGPSGWEDRGYGAMKDMHRYPGPAMYEAMNDRATILGEFGGLGWPVAGHLWQPDQNWGYRTYGSREELRSHYEALVRDLPAMIGRGLAAAIYTQTTDVEGEVNGLMTYDRAVVKLDTADLASMHRPLYEPQPAARVLVPTAEDAATEWRHTTARPSDDWTAVNFDDAAWEKGKSGFGTRSTPNSIVGTRWNSEELWLRRSFQLDARPAGTLVLRVFHDDAADVYINGVLASSLPAASSEYRLVQVSAEAQAALKAGNNVLAVRAEHERDGQFVDTGLWIIAPRGD